MSTVLEQHRPIALVLLLLLGALALVVPKGARGEALTENAIMQRNLAATKVATSIADATFTLRNKGGAERIRKSFGATKLQSNGDDNMRMVRFMSPADIKGTTTLLIEHGEADDDMWVYLPALKKVRRLVSSNKKDSFVGTDFSYGDVIGHKVEEWTHRLLREEVVDGAACYVIESLPRNETVAANSGYSKRITWVRKDNFVSPRAEFWDTAGQPLKRIAASDIRPAGKEGHWQPMITEAENLQSGHKTIVRLDRFEADAGIEASLFTTRYLETE